MSDLRLGVSLHSFAHEYCSMIWSLEDLFTMASSLGGGVEIVGPSHQRGFPHLTDEFESVFRSAVDRHGLVPTCYGSYSDPYVLPDRDLTDDELLEYTIPQLRAAARLGFPVVRLQHFTAGIIDRLLPLADELDLVLGWELHVPMTLRSGRTRMLLDLVARHDTPRLGIIPDAGIFARSISRPHLRRGRELGIGEDTIAAVTAAWEADSELDAALELLGGPPPESPVTTWAGLIWDTFGRSDPAELDEVIDRVVHLHGKFFDIVDGDEPDLRYRELVGTLTRLGYPGWISSEYEGAVGIGEGGAHVERPDSYERVLAHHQMIRRYEAGTR